MSKYEVLIKAVTIQGLSYAEVARRHGVSKSLIHKLHHRWLAEGDTAFQARLIHNNDATVITTTGEVLAEYTLDPTKSYQRKNG